MNFDHIENQLAAARSHLEGGNLSAAENAMPRFTNGIRSNAPELWTKLNCFSNDLDLAKANAFLCANIPPDFLVLSQDLYPSPESLAIALSTNLADQFDDNGQPRPGYKGGILLHGVTGTGKTRAAFAMLRQYLKSDPERRFRYVSAPVLKRKLADAARGGKAHAILEELIGDDDAILFIDDLSQARFTASFAENLFELIDRICREHLTLLVTVQTSGSDLVRKWCADDKDLADTAAAIARRLKDYCVAIKFEKSTTKAA